MSASVANSSFQLPSLSYIDAKWEEPSLAAQQPVASGGLAAWLSRRVGALAGWYRNQQTAAELAGMSDYELADIGLARSDLTRVFRSEFNQDLALRGTYR